MNSSEVVGFVPVQDIRIDSEMTRSKILPRVMNTIRLEGQRDNMSHENESYDKTKLKR